VVKIGSSSLTENGIISRKKIARMVDDVAGLRRRGYQVAIVTSGAIATGAGTLGKSIAKSTMPEKQAFAAVGQTVLMNEYRNRFSAHGLHVGQILLTSDDVKNRVRFLNARHTFEELLRMGIVPIVNENDTVAIREIRFGDNDMLSAHVSCMINADLLIILSDVDGFYMDLHDPEPVEEIRAITNTILERAGGTGSAVGTGGMISKIRAAQIIMHFGEKMIIASANMPRVLNRIMDGEKIGTLFIGRERPLAGRKRWLALRRPSGTLSLDSGAVLALREGKKSLLATGITALKGKFLMGDIVELADPNGTIIGKGIVNYESNDLHRIIGKKSSEIKKILGEKMFDEVINRDDMIIY